VATVRTLQNKPWMKTQLAKACKAFSPTIKKAPGRSGHRVSALYLRSIFPQSTRDGFSLSTKGHRSSLNDLENQLAAGAVHHPKAIEIKIRQSCSIYKCKCWTQERPPRVFLLANEQLLACFTHPDRAG